MKKSKLQHVHCSWGTQIQSQFDWCPGDQLNRILPGRTCSILRSSFAMSAATRLFVFLSPPIGHVLVDTHKTFVNLSSDKNGNRYPLIPGIFPGYRAPVPDAVHISRCAVAPVQELMVLTERCSVLTSGRRRGDILTQMTGIGPHSQVRVSSSGYLAPAPQFPSCGCRRPVHGPNSLTGGVSVPTIGRSSGDILSEVAFC